MTTFVLFTDFGAEGPYLGQLQAVLQQQAPGVPVIDLLSNAPQGNPRLSAYLLAALRHFLPARSIFLSIVDPGVGGPRAPVVLQADGQYFVGPDNGLFNTLAGQARSSQCWQIVWRPERCSMSFHGRDLFAPVAARLATGDATEMLKPWQLSGMDDWLPDLPALIYFDHYGNAVTGLRSNETLSGRKLRIGREMLLSMADTFCALPAGQAFWYNNSMGLVEIAINRGSARDQLQLQLGMPVEFL